MTIKTTHYFNVFTDLNHKIYTYDFETEHPYNIACYVLVGLMNKKVLLDEGTDYLVDKNLKQIILLKTLPEETNLLGIQRNTDINQLKKLTANAFVRNEDIENAFDKLTCLVQENMEIEFNGDSSGIAEDAPVDNNYYCRKNANWFSMENYLTEQ
jgi:hypothetical protein